MVGRMPELGDGLPGRFVCFGGFYFCFRITEGSKASIFLGKNDISVYFRLFSTILGGSLGYSPHLIIACSHSQPSVTSCKCHICSPGQVSHLFVLTVARGIGKATLASVAMVPRIILVLFLNIHF